MSLRDATKPARLFEGLDDEARAETARALFESALLALRGGVAISFSEWATWSLEERVALAEAADHLRFGAPVSETAALQRACDAYANALVRRLEAEGAPS